MEQETNSNSSFGNWTEEKKKLDAEKTAHPELFERPVLIDDDAILESIGIDPAIFGARLLGHIKLFAEDFIVEETDKQNTTHTIDDGPFVKTGESLVAEEIRTVWADVVKMGVDTLEVVNECATHLGIDKKAIGFAGIKDKHALTSQALTFRGIDPRRLEALNAHNFFFKNVALGKGALQVGDLLGNRFTIYIRTQKKSDEAKLTESLRDLEEQGFWNFFYIQRFGVPRLISHKLGLLILQGKYEEAVKAAITSPGEREIPYFRNFRTTLATQWGNWNVMHTSIMPLEYSFRNEKKMVTYLLNHPKDFIGALNQIPEQIKLWVYAYGSYLFNTTLSQLITKGDEVPFSLPLALSGDPRAKEFYGAFFEAHDIKHPFPALRNFPHIQRPEKDIEVLKKFTLHGVRVIDGGVILDFFLEKASYATTFLSHIFTLSSGLPLPAKISTDEIDTKLLLGTGTIAPLKEKRFNNVFAMRLEKPVETDEI